MTRVLVLALLLVGCAHRQSAEASPAPAVAPMSSPHREAFHCFGARVAGGGVAKVNGVEAVLCARGKTACDAERRRSFETVPNLAPLECVPHQRATCLLNASGSERCFGTETECRAMVQFAAGNGTPVQRECILE